jgi:hypothetical protein
VRTSPRRIVIDSGLIAALIDAENSQAGDWEPRSSFRLEIELIGQLSVALGEDIG